MRRKGRASPYQADSGFEIAPMDLTQQGFEQTKRDHDLSDRCAGIALRTVDIFCCDLRVTPSFFWAIPIPIGISRLGNGCSPRAWFLGMIFFLTPLRANLG